MREVGAQLSAAAPRHGRGRCPFCGLMLVPDPFIFSVFRGKISLEEAHMFARHAQQSWPSIESETTKVVALLLQERSGASPRISQRLPPVS